VTTRWQQYVLDVALERVDGPGSPFAYSDVGVIVGRRGGKTVTTMGVPLYRALGGPVTLDNGITLPFVGAHTAQNLVKARGRFMKDLVEPLRDNMSPAVWAAGHNLRSAIGDTSLTLDPAVVGKDWRLPRASTISVFAPTRSSVRGDGIFHITFDEALVFSAELGRDLFAGAGPTQGTLRGHGQIWVTSNISVLNNDTTWLAGLRDKGRAAVESGATTGTAWFEFTVADGVDVTDEQVWWEVYPGLSDGLVRVEELRTDLVRLGLDSFAAEYLGRWPSTAAAAAWSAIAERVWRGAGVDEELPEGAGAIGVDVDPFGRASSIVGAVDDPARPGGVLVEALEHDIGSGWVADRVAQLAPGVDAIGIDDYGAGHDLITTLSTDPAIAAKIVPTKALDFASACYAFDADLRESRLHWRRAGHHDALTAAAGAVQRTPGKAWQWERRVATPVSPFVAGTLASWALRHAPASTPWFAY